MTNSKKSEMVTILYFVTFIIALFSNINMIAEAPVKLYNYVVTVLFLVAKIRYCLSKEKNRYSVWINLAAFLAAVFVLIFSDNIDNGFTYMLAMALYVPVGVPYAPVLLLLLGSNNNKVLPMIIVLMHLVFLGVSIIVSLIYRKQKKTCADQRR